MLGRGIDWEGKRVNKDKCRYLGPGWSMNVLLRLTLVAWPNSLPNDDHYSSNPLFCLLQFYDSASNNKIIVKYSMNAPSSLKMPYYWTPLAYASDRDTLGTFVVIRIYTLYVCFYYQ